MTKILVVEDDQILSRMYTEKFKTRGYEVVVSLSGEQGLIDAEREKPDLILLDLMMKKMDGLTMLDKIKANPKTWDIPVAILTVMPKDIAERLSENLDSKVIGYWRKDEAEPMQIVERVDKYLAERQPGKL